MLQLLYIKRVYTVFIKSFCSESVVTAFLFFKLQLLLYLKTNWTGRTVILREIIRQSIYCG